MVLGRGVCKTQNREPVSLPHHPQAPGTPAFHSPVEAALNRKTEFPGFVNAVNADAEQSSFVTVVCLFAFILKQEVQSLRSAYQYHFPRQSSSHQTSSNGGHLLGRGEMLSVGEKGWEMSCLPV